MFPFKKKKLGYPSIQVVYDDIVVKLALLHQLPCNHRKQQNAFQSKIVVQDSTPCVELHGKNCRNNMVLLVRQGNLIALILLQE